ATKPMPRAYMVSSVGSSGPSAKRLAVSLNRLLAPTDSATDVSSFTGASQCALLMCAFGGVKRTSRKPPRMSAFSNRPSGVKRFQAIHQFQCRRRSRALASLRTRHQGPSIMGFEDEVEQSLARPCRQCDDRFKRTYGLTSSIVPRGTSFHRWVDLRFSSYLIWSSVRLSRCGDLPGPSEV